MHIYTAGILVYCCENFLPNFNLLPTFLNVLVFSFFPFGCWGSGIVNFQDWAVTDIPGQGSLDLNTFLCKQPVSVVVYDFTAASASATAHRAR